MDITAHCPLANLLAERLRDARDELTMRWLERIKARVALMPQRIFPTDDLLDHMPLLILGIADYLEDPAQVVSSDPPVVAKAMELGALRLAQGFDEYEILKEYEIFGGILFNFLARVSEEAEEECSRGELMVCGHRVFQAVTLVQQATLMHYLRLMKERIVEREERLRAFNRTLTHELRNRMGAAMGAGQLLEMPDLAEEKREELAGVVVRNIDSMRVVLDNLLELTRVNQDARQQRHVRLPQAAAEAARQLRDLARGREVELRVGEDLPDVEVNAAVVELALMNLLSNAIKYADPAKAERWAEVSGRVTTDADGRPNEAVITVRDNGLGVPREARSRLFERYFRAHEHSAGGVEGTGLGLSIVRETVQSIGGRAWAEFPDEGAVFAFAVPCRRASDHLALEESGATAFVADSEVR